jgi:anti-sigma factor RsiW
MIDSCAEIRPRFEPYSADALSAGERTAVREHLRGCAACRSEAAALDPLLLFSAARPEAVSAEETAAMLASVRSAIAVRSAERRLARRGRGRRLAAAAAVAALLVLAVTLAGGHGNRAVRERPSAPNVAAAPAPPAFVPAARERPDTKFPAEATVYDWNPGAGQPRVVWIVDRSLDI